MRAETLLRKQANPFIIAAVLFFSVVIAGNQIARRSGLIPAKEITKSVLQRKACISRILEPIAL
jgi:hypothetical protein